MLRLRSRVSALLIALLAGCVDPGAPAPAAACQPDLFAGEDDPSGAGDFGSRDYFSAPIFLARLLPDPAAAPLAMHTDRSAFLGDGDVASPAAASAGTPPGPPLGPVSASGQPALLADEVDLLVPAGGCARLRYAYGSLPEGFTLDSLDASRDPEVDPGAATAVEWGRGLPRFEADGAGTLPREEAWHAAQLLQAAVMDDGFSDWPVQNSNAHAMPLLALLRVAGLSPAEGGGLEIAPRVLGGRFTLETPPISLDVGPGRIAGTYRAAAATTTLEVALGEGVWTARVGDVPVDVADGAAAVRLPIDLEAGEEVEFVVEAVP